MCHGQVYPQIRRKVGEFHGEPMWSADAINLRITINRQKGVYKDEDDAPFRERRCK